MELPRRESFRVCFTTDLIIPEKYLDASKEGKLKCEQIENGTPFDE